jgi:hypothetical protein
MAIKKSNVHHLIELAWNAGNVRLSTLHGTQRSKERLIGTTEIRDVILYGKREEKYDTDKGTHWIYSIRNLNVDGRDIRIIFDVEGYPDVVIVTVMLVHVQR